MLVSLCCMVEVKANCTKDLLCFNFVSMSQKCWDMGEMEDYVSH